MKIPARRASLYEKAKARNPNPWTKEIRDWSHVDKVVLNPAQSTGKAAGEAA